ncbi:MAG TPA: hypothetical protein VLG92_05095 [Candidatus Saccharimonadia bacterium]|nr:hypothetical protein [Candidatus Saccharimonadia bacterium]
MSIRDSIRRFVPIAAAIALASACSSSGPAPCNPVTPQAAVAASSPSPTPSPIEVAPAVGSKLGVVAHGKRAVDDPSSGGLKYSCTNASASIPVSINDKVEYNGTTVQFITSHPTAPDGTVDTSNQNTVVTLTFGGTTLHATSAIVSFVNVVGTDSSGHDVFAAEDDQVVNLQDVTLTTAGIALETSYFVRDGAFIGGVELCLAG